MLLSIITINLNNVAGLVQTIRSIVRQTATNFEYIVIDGGSTDGSLKVLEDNMHYIDYCVSEKDEGIYQAMNKGIKVAKGIYTLFLNSGDILFDENSLTHITPHLINQEADIYYTDVIFIDDVKEKANRYSYPKTINTSYFLPKSLCHQTAIIRRDLFDKIGLYNENYRMASDWSFFLKAATQNYTFKYIEGLVLSYFLLNGFSNDYVLGKKEQRTIIETEYPKYAAKYQEATQNNNYLSRIVNKLFKVAMALLSTQKKLYAQYTNQISINSNH